MDGIKGLGQGMENFHRLHSTTIWTKRLFLYTKKCVQYLRPQRGSETGWTDRSRPRERNRQPTGSVPAGLILTQQPTLCVERKKTIQKADRQLCTCLFVAASPRTRVTGAFACWLGPCEASACSRCSCPLLTLPFLPLLLQRGPGGNAGNALLMTEH